MLIKNTSIENKKDYQDIRIEDGKFVAIADKLEPMEEEEVVDCKNKLLLPPFVESHVHLDTCLTAGEPRWNMSGTLFEGIDCWEERKPMLTKDDVKTRVNKVIRMEASNGIQYIRTHVDCILINLLVIVKIQAFLNV